ncbi:hypothetical protein [Enterocloster sp.]|uniref:hypothetical protein n=1 Tax=Enterocloster sp. TaxID=2719315 RepID=UPI0039A077CD
METEKVTFPDNDRKEGETDGKRYWMHSQKRTAEVTFSDFYRLIRESTSAELMKMPWTATPHRYIREMVTGAGGDRHGTGW